VSTEAEKSAWFDWLSDWDRYHLLIDNYDLIGAGDEIRGFLQAFVDGSMSRNNAETLAAEILERIGK
jgi:hypothetical protein